MSQRNYTSDGMTQVIKQMFLVPIGLMAANLEYLSQALRGIHDDFEPPTESPGGVDRSRFDTQTITSGPAKPTIFPEEIPVNTLSQTQANRCYTSDCDPSQSFQDCDLSGEGVIKRIRWYVTFTKEDFVASFGIEHDKIGGGKETNYVHEEIITENTTHDRVWGEKKGQFMAAMAATDVPVPKEWISAGVVQKPAEATLNDPVRPTHVLSLSREGLEDYLDIQIECVARSCEVKPCYEKDQIGVLRELNRSVQTWIGRQPNQGQPNQGQPNQGQPNQGQPNQGPDYQGPDYQGPGDQR